MKSWPAKSPTLYIPHSINVMSIPSLVIPVFHIYIQYSANKSNIFNGFYPSYIFAQDFIACNIYNIISELYKYI